MSQKKTKIYKNYFTAFTTLFSSITNKMQRYTIEELLELKKKSSGSGPENRD